MPTPPTEAVQDIRPIREAVEIPVPEVAPAHSPVWMWILLGVVLFAIALGLFIWWKRRHTSSQLPNLQKQSIAQLEEARSLMTPENSRAFTIAVSNILRHFIETRFHLPSTRQTTPEFLRNLTTNSPINLGPYQTSLQTFFEQCDFGKFSGDTLSQEALQSLYQTSLDVITSEPTHPQTNLDNASTSSSHV